MKRLLIPALFALMLAACQNTPITDEQNGAPVGGGNQVTPVDPSIGSGVLPDELLNPKSKLSKRSIYFDLDSYEVKGEYKDLVAAHAKYLNAHRDFKVLLQGNTDERGTPEYNLSLGQKRADAVKRSLSLLGVSEDQIESVSLGKEKPKALGHDEASWAENRRADILYRGPKGGEY